MEILNVIAIFLLVSSTFAYPSKPLDERSTELTWQAWLLVDDQNQNKQNNEGGGMKKKVIAKSVFIVPTFNPEKLPPCADGYASDSMGRCLEVFQVDPKNQLEFLLSKLQSHLASNHKISTGPEKFTIEIPGNENGHDDTSAALVLTQSPKADEKNVHNLVAPSEDSDLSKVRIEDKNPEEATETTISTPTTSTSTETEPTTGPPATEPVFSTVSNFGDEETTEDPILTTTLAAPAEEPTETMPTTLVTEDNRQAIFFKLPATTQDSEKASESDFALSSRIHFKDDAFSNDQPPTQDSTNVDYVSSSRIIFRDASPDTGGDLLTSENVRHATNVVRFPDDDGNRRNSEHSNNHRSQFNHRNRDKNFWRLKPSWRDSERNTFLVNLSNINFNDLLVQNRHSSPMYRQIPAEHLSYIFGRHNNNR